PGEVVLEADPAHWGGAPRLKRVVFRRLAGEDALVQGLPSGQGDVTSARGPERGGRLHGHPEITLDSFTGLNIAFLSINNDRAPFHDVRGRRAGARAAD